ncbi:hypothetical protein H312_03660, partial [Anncaliia algerae PRA339]
VTIFLIFDLYFYNWLIIFLYIIKIHLLWLQGVFIPWINVLKDSYFNKLNSFYTTCLSYLWFFYIYFFPSVGIPFFINFILLIKFIQNKNTSIMGILTFYLP